MTIEQCDEVKFTLIVQVFCLTWSVSDDLHYLMTEQEKKTEASNFELDYLKEKKQFKLFSGQ